MLQRGTLNPVSTRGSPILKPQNTETCQEYRNDLAKDLTNSHSYTPSWKHIGPLRICFPETAVVCDSFFGSYPAGGSQRLPDSLFSMKSPYMPVVRCGETATFASL